VLSGVILLPMGVHKMLTNRQKLILAALATNSTTRFAPVQVQKIFFLIDNNIANDIGGKQFNFAPYDYGPFDKDVYLELNELSKLGFVTIDNPAGTTTRKYSLTELGVSQGRQGLMTHSDRAQKYIPDVVSWVSKLGFAELVGAVYQAYPEMRVNSIFK
jgi:uncharacterized protein YwgA